MMGWRASNTADEPVQDDSAFDCVALVATRHGLPAPADEARASLRGRPVYPKHVVRIAERAGLAAVARSTDWAGLVALRKALPAVVRLTTGAYLVLDAVVDSDRPNVTLLDPNAGEQASLVIDRARFEQAWTGEVVTLRREFAFADENQPFGLRYVLALLWRERRMLRDLVICALCLGVLSLAPVAVWRLLTGKVIVYHALNTFAVIVACMGVVIVFEAAFTYLRGVLLARSVARVEAALSDMVFHRLLDLPMDFFERTRAGKIAHDLFEIPKIRQFMTTQLFAAMLDSLVMALMLPVLFAFNPTLTAALMLVCAAVVVWFLAFLPSYIRATHPVIEAEADRDAFLIQTLQGMRTVKSLALENQQRKTWDAHVALVTERRQRQSFIGAVIMNGVKPLELAAMTLPFTLGVYLALDGQGGLQIGMILAFALLSQRVSGPLINMAKMINYWEEARSAMRVVSGLVNRAKEDRRPNGLRTPIEGKVAFKDLTFTYHGARRPALDRVSFEVPIGATLGIVGRSGSGKTTVTRLLQRLHADYQGRIEIDGVDIRDYEATHLRRSVGVVLQDNFLFSGSIRENIGVARRDASMEEIVRVARLAGAEEFIDRLPRGYDTHIFEGSPNLSGGQRQRLAIARALLVDPRVLILDEATSALDPDSEAIVNDNIHRIAAGRTVIAISHRLSSLVASDSILVLERGALADKGTHAELLDRCEIYAALWHQQNQHAQASARAGRPQARRIAGA